MHNQLSRECRRADVYSDFLFTKNIEKTDETEKERKEQRRSSENAGRRGLFESLLVLGSQSPSKGVLARVHDIQESILIHVLLVHLRQQTGRRRQDIVDENENRFLWAVLRTWHS